MSRKPSLYQVLAGAGWLLTACASEGADPGSRGGTRGMTSSPGTAANPGTVTPGPGTTMPTSGAAGGNPHVITPATVPVTPGVGPNGDGVCEIVQLVTNPQVPDMMIVLDRSGSMEEGGRWDPSVSAVRKITTDLQARIRFGLALFPESEDFTWMSSGTNGGITVSFGGGSGCAPGKVVVPIAPMNAGPIGTQLDMTQPNGGTPTSETLMKLVADYADMEPAPDMQPHPKFVLLVTDGAPTCPNGRGEDTNQADIDASYAAIDALTERGVKTFVIGYDTATPGNEMLAQVLDGFAQRGGTGDQMHRPVEDEASLTAALESITATISSCSFTLDKAPERANYVLVTLDGKQLNLDDPNGWRMSDDKTVEIVGEACNTFKTGTHLLNAEVQCMVVQPS
jgi:hypothetical protein